MIIDNLDMPAHNTTLMGVIRGVVDYFGIEQSDAMLYGASGHAFLINIHEQLCPSGPYCWNYERFHQLVRNLGIRMFDMGFYSPDKSTPERKALEIVLIDYLNKKTPCSLLNMENQLIIGYDKTGFVTTQPWECNPDFPPDHLTFGSWDELGENYHARFYYYKQVTPAEERKAIADSLDFALHVYQHPEEHSLKGYCAGLAAYNQWINAVENGHGDSHGHWWNATVWAECRRMAAEYFNEISSKYPDSAPLSLELRQHYNQISTHLATISNKDMPAAEKIALLKETAAIEEQCIPLLNQLHNLFANHDEMSNTI